MKLENQNDVATFFLEEPPLPFGAWEQQVSYMEGFNLPGLLEYDPYPFAHQTTSNVELNDFEDISGDLGLWDFDDQMATLDNDHFNLINPNPLAAMQTLNHESHQPQDINVYDNPENHTEPSNNNNNNKRNGRYKSSSLQLEEIKKYFDVPITRAAKELNVGLTVLKKRCRELNIDRWPHRKIKSLKSLIHNVKELGLTSEIEMLEEHKRMVERIPEMELTERTKKLRQACFKANYKKRRTMQQSLYY